MDRKVITIVIPVFNEEENIEHLIHELQSLSLPYEVQILLVDDGSTDRTVEIIKRKAIQNHAIHYIQLVKNFGHQIALKAGLDHAKGDAVISMDGDMQHPIKVLQELIKKWEEGFEIVITQRVDSEDVGFRKKMFSKVFYRLMNFLSNIPITYGEADFRLLDKKVVHVIRTINEPDIFLRGLVRWVGFKTTLIKYQSEKRQAGKSKYTIRKMMSLALNGIISFSTKPLYYSIYLGFACSMVSLLVLVYALISYFNKSVIPGWTSTLIIMSFFSGVQLILLGIVGLYIGKLFMQAKNRPLYIIRESTCDEEK